MQKAEPQVMLGTLFCMHKTTCCFAPTGSLETSNSEAKHSVVHAQNDRSCLGPIETCYSCPEVAVLHAKTTVGGLEPQRLVIPVLKSLFITHKVTGEVRDS